MVLGMQTTGQRKGEMKRRLLIIDDDEALVPAMADFFSHHGYEVKCAAEAEEAVAMIRHHRFAVVITDLELNSIEGLDGFSVLKALRQFCPTTRVVVYSGYADDLTVEACLRDGATKFLAKPVSLYELLACAEGLCPTHC
jgi:DNA-binding NtrC family response regulator